MRLAKCIFPAAGSRRRFLAAAAVSGLTFQPNAPAAEPEQNVLGPRAGYSPQIGTLVSQMIWMRGAVLSTVKGLSIEQLDFLLDDKANRIGALLLHLAATDKLYQLNTFGNVGLPDLQTAPAFEQYAIAMELGAPARDAIQHHPLDFYLSILHDTREKTLAEFRKRDDAWLMQVDKSWPWGPTNNLCKWFHVCEHESHHAGQIAMLRARATGAKADNG